MILYSFLIVLCVAGILALLLYMERVEHAETRRQFNQVMDVAVNERRRREDAEADLARAQPLPRPSLPPSGRPPQYQPLLGDSSLPTLASTYSMEDLEREL